METAAATVVLSPRNDPKPEAWIISAALGALATALSVMLVGLSNLPAPYGNGFSPNWTLWGMGIAVGGAAQFTAGLLSFRAGDMFRGTAFAGYGSFWLAFTLMNTHFIPTSSSSVTMYGLAGFSFVWLLFTCTMLINAPRYGWGVTAAFVLLLGVFCLCVLQYVQLGGGVVISAGEHWAIAIEVLLAGLAFWYVGTADLTNWNYRRKVLPV